MMVKYSPQNESLNRQLKFLEAEAENLRSQGEENAKLKTLLANQNESMKCVTNELIALKETSVDKVLHMNNSGVNKCSLILDKCLEK